MLVISTSEVSKRVQEDEKENEEDDGKFYTLFWLMEPFYYLLVAAWRRLLAFLSCFVDHEMVDLKLVPVCGPLVLLSCIL